MVTRDHRRRVARRPFRGGAGGRVRGSNKQGRTRWHRICEFTTVDAPNELRWRTVSTALFPDSSVWCFRLTTQDDGSTRIEQSFEVVRLNRVLDHLYWLLVPAHRDRSAALAGDLARLADVAETEALGRGTGSKSNEPSRPADC